MLSDAPAETIELLDDFGLAMGLAFQLSDDIMDVISSEEELHKQPGQDMKLGVYTLPVLHALHDGEAGRELEALLSEGPPSGERLARALEIVRNDGSLSRARAAVTKSVTRATSLAASLAPGPARDAMVHITEFLSVRCGAST
jgi:geranylgeranyl pyrophosphate synthase